MDTMMATLPTCRHKNNDAGAQKKKKNRTIRKQKEPGAKNKLN